MSALVVTDLQCGYGRSDIVVDGVDCAVAPGQVVCIVGPNGAGKSTLLRAVAGLLTIRRGRVRLGERDITGLSPKAIAKAGVVYVPQERNVFGELSVRENLEIGGYLTGGRVRTRLGEILARFPELAASERRPARVLSGGQRQSLAIAMALMREPQVLLLDEPTAGLAAAAVDRLFDLLAQIRASGIPIILVEQNAYQALSFADVGVVLVDGRNHRTGPAADLLADPNFRLEFLGVRADEGNPANDRRPQHANGPD